MPFTIHCELDITDGFEPDSLVGRIQFSDGHKLFQEEAVYLDSWLCALTKAAQDMEAGLKEVVIDLVEEPQPLHVARDSSGSVHVSFRGKDVAAQTVTGFRQTLSEAAESFVNQVRQLSGSDYTLPCKPE